jgi:hypothetical protein
MKRQALVLITIDPDAKPGSSKTSHDEGKMMDPQTKQWIDTPKFEISIIPSTGDVTDVSLNLRTSLAHELGHVVGYLAKTPASMNDPRSKPMGNRWTPNAGDAVRASEREAWDIARQIDPTIDPIEEQRALETYSGDDVDVQFGIATLLDSLLAHSDTLRHTN